MSRYNDICQVSFLIFLIFKILEINVNCLELEYFEIYVVLRILYYFEFMEVIYVMCNFLNFGEQIIVVIENVLNEFDKSCLLGSQFFMNL